MDHIMSRSEELYSHFNTRPMIFQNIIFDQSTSYGGIYLKTQNNTPKISFDFINCTFDNSGGYNFEFMNSDEANFKLRFDLFNNSNLRNPQGSYTDQGIGFWQIRKKIQNLSLPILNP